MPFGWVVRPWGSLSTLDPLTATPCMSSYGAIAEEAKGAWPRGRRLVLSAWISLEQRR